MPAHPLILTGIKLSDKDKCINTFKEGKTSRH